MNVHDSQGLEGLLAMGGYQKTESVEQADVVVFNTCCVRQSAENRIYGNIGALKILKKQKPEMILCVVGCMASKTGTIAKIQKSYPFVDIVLGTGGLGRLLECINFVKQGQKVYDNSVESRVQEDYYLRENGVSAYVSIIQGCDKFCTYCIVPYVRGRESSRPFEDIVQECSNLLQKGYKEITLLGQNVNSYRDQTNDFADLLRALDALPFHFILKYMTSHPIDFGDKMIDTIAESKNISHSVHLPVQAGADRILQLMNRKYTKEHYLSSVKRLRHKVPDISITTDIMVGFPTETHEEFLDTLDVVRQVQFSNIFSFVFSPREGTPAAKMEGKIDLPTKRERIKTLIQEQEIIATNIAKQAVGKTMECLCTQSGEKTLAKTRDDRVVMLPAHAMQMGEFAQVKIVDTKNSSLIGQLVK